MKDMKTIVTHLCIITATLLSLSGCSDFLDEKPQGNTGTNGKADRTHHHQGNRCPGN